MQEIEVNGVRMLLNKRTGVTQWMGHREGDRKIVDRKFAPSMILSIIY